MTPLEAHTELVNMGVDPRRYAGSRVCKLPDLLDTIMAECSEPEGWVHITSGTACDSELRWHSFRDIYVCVEHDVRVRRDA